MGEGLTFKVSYSRRVQPQDYEHITIGWEEQFQKYKVSREEAYNLVRDIVETQSHRRLQELWAQERE